MDELSDIPDVSVVISVYNGAQYLASGLGSVLEQREVGLEVIVIDDGSTDRSAAILAEIAAGDPRVRLVTQSNAGLTRALILGCSLARGRYIARQDSDDLSMPGRFAAQVALLDARPDVVFVSSWADVIGPNDEPLLTHERPADVDAATELLMRGRVGPPGHGSVMMRREAYERVGGYRAVFYYAQDSDLWLRLGMIGKLAYIPRVLYQYRISAESISGRMNAAKMPYARLINRLHRARHAGDDEASIIAAADLSPDPEPDRKNGSRDATEYFIARCLIGRRDGRAGKYLRRCLAANPRNWRAWLLLPLAHALSLWSAILRRR